MPNWFTFGRRADLADSRFPKETPLGDVRFAAVDTELTSLDTRSNRLLSIGAIAMDGSKIRIAEQFYRLVNPGVAVPAQSILIHKLLPSDDEQRSCAIVGWPSA
jgi:DNA polymerase-3 subunit epsilon